MRFGARNHVTRAGSRTRAGAGSKTKPIGSLRSKTRWVGCRTAESRQHERGRIKEALRDIYRNNHSDAAQSALAPKKWPHWAQRSQLHPIKELSKTINPHWAGILKAFDGSHLHTGYGEAVNSVLQAAKAKARGDGTTNHFIAKALFDMAEWRHRRRCRQ